MSRVRAFWGAALGLVALGLSACTEVPTPVEPVAKPIARPNTPKPPQVTAPPRVARPTSEASALLRSYLNQVQGAQLSQGLLRRDGGGVDTPYTDTMLARNFEQIALFNEYNGSFTGRGGASPLRRWAAPIRMDVIFGDSVPPSQRKTDLGNVSSYAARLNRVTGHPVSMSRNANFIVVIASEDDRGEALAQAAARVPGISASSLTPLNNLPRDTYCVVAAYAAGAGANTYTAALAVIRSENPSLLRLSCIHEELAQGMGLANDSPNARPSIFNDDDEFALLTSHDEKLLQMLYDPRLKTGMNASQARPIVQKIASEIVTRGPV
ncbi:DUF2927 domain-containing protein [Sulfitobacter donghicola]|uniref:Lipoprotein n=1 Tax=Sulfitobacter donghicola DSW-25 = KCTC 12864 = JCM 14565 TaxID=1300350 RepID=A0A073IJV1_9RHOB|nr:DUF2927 domain-containing protein [Sulfitobacter donghicola]KEJ89875.1 hypothetical protein DSW25_06580 [Sulfitobacter donghicola DSW-25 = KCTC 12864 = JCM 14565]KIN67004.1 Lipoprotein [Sulfitobacter donghicola DSW-25 = KCTC 12864 = JCM 14565]